jgi:hypothetical protein
MCKRYTPKIYAKKQATMSLPLILCVVAVVGLLCCRLTLLTVHNLLSCWRNPTLSRPEKAFWLGAIIFVWPLGGFLYEVIVEKKPIIRFSVIFLAFSLTFCATILYLRPDVREGAWEAWKTSNSPLEMLEQTHMQPPQKKP